MAGQNMFT